MTPRVVEVQVLSAALRKHEGPPLGAALRRSAYARFRYPKMAWIAQTTHAIMYIERTPMR